MPSPLPGMNPYLEAPDIWEDFHANLATEIRSRLTPQLRPRYIAVLTPHVTYEELSIQETRLAKPDVAIVKQEERPWDGAAVAIAPLIGRVALEVPIRSQSIEIRETKTGLLVTAIEILSPVNKRPGHEAFDTYRRKRRDLLRTDVHLLEIDLLRAGQHPPLETRLPDLPYFVFLSRGEQRPRVDIWPLKLQEPIPLLPVPLLAPDPDVALDLGHAIQTIYDEAAYDLRIDYHQPPPKPDLAQNDATWLDAHLRTADLRD
ncbi:MAG: DUF4058 family protein [Roseiflexaceae bacterium]